MFHPNVLCFTQHIKNLHDEPVSIHISQHILFHSSCSSLRGIGNRTKLFNQTTVNWQNEPRIFQDSCLLPVKLGIFIPPSWQLFLFSRNLEWLSHGATTFNVTFSKKPLRWYSGNQTLLWENKACNYSNTNSNSKFFYYLRFLIGDR